MQSFYEAQCGCSTSMDPTERSTTSKHSDSPDDKDEWLCRRRECDWACHTAETDEQRAEQLRLRQQQDRARHAVLCSTDRDTFSGSPHNALHSLVKICYIRKIYQHSITTCIYKDGPIMCAYILLCFLYTNWSRNKILKCTEENKLLPI